ncbi:Recombination-associated protein RdgC [compost metagenome]
MSDQFFRTLRLYRLNENAAQLIGRDLNEDLVKHTFRPGQNIELQSIGWAPYSEHSDNLAHAGQGDKVQFFMRLRVENKVMPPAAINQITKARAAEIAEQQGYRPGRKQMKEIKERVTDELLVKALSVTRDTRVWLNLTDRFLVIDAASSSRADEVIGMLAKAIDPFPLENLYVAKAPASAMTGWLAEDEAPANFTIDQDTELRSSGESGAAIRYVKHSIDADDVRRHIQSGKQCTRLAMTWADRISFVLTEDLVVKRLRPLDVLRENTEDMLGSNDEEKFESDLALFAGEATKLIAELIDALGGEKTL